MRGFLRWAVVAQVVGTVLFTLVELSNASNASEGRFDATMVWSATIEAALSALGLALFFGLGGVWLAYRKMIREHKE